VPHISSRELCYFTEITDGPQISFQTLPYRKFPLERRYITATIQFAKRMYKPGQFMLMI
jgi:hypothetical protein